MSDKIVSNEVMNAQDGIINELISTAVSEGLSKNDDVTHGACTDKVNTETHNFTEGVDDIIQNPVIHAASIENLQNLDGIKATVAEVSINEAAGDNKSKSKFAFKRFFKRSRKQCTVQESAKKCGGGAYSAGNDLENKPDGEDDKQSIKQLQKVGKMDLEASGSNFVETSTAHAILTDSPHAGTSAAYINRAANHKSSFSGYWKSLFRKSESKVKPTVILLEDLSIEEGFTNIDLNSVKACPNPIAEDVQKYIDETNRTHEADIRIGFDAHKEELQNNVMIDHDDVEDKE